MSLRIDSNLEYIKTRLGLSDAQMQVYAQKTVNEIIIEEAQKGNQAAIQLAVEMFTNANQLIELFQLANVENKYIILHSMSSTQLDKLLPLLEHDDLVEGLNFFDMDALLDMLEKLPKEELVKTVLQMFSEREIIELMPEKQLDKVLTGFDMNKNLLLNNLKFIPLEYVQQMLESVTGEAAEGSHAELVNQLGQLGDLNYKAAIRNMDLEQKRRLTLLITSSDNRYYLNFDSDAYTHIIGREREKDETVKAMGAIKDEYLQKMLMNLPQDLLSIVITQIDTQKFAQVLIDKNPEIIARFIGG